MEKVTKSFVQKIYPGIIVSEDFIEEISERDPMMVQNDSRIQGFRFFDQEYAIDGEKSYIGEKKNYSGWIFFGNRLSLEEIETTYGDNPNYKVLIGNMKNNGYKYVCHTQVGTFLPMRDNDVTFDEYIQEFNNDVHKKI